MNRSLMYRNGSPRSEPPSGAQSAGTDHPHGDHAMITKVLPMPTMTTGVFFRLAHHRTFLEGRPRLSVHESPLFVAS
jgi:hypothetical protein